MPEEHERIWREKPKTPGRLRAQKLHRKLLLSRRGKELVGRFHQPRVRTLHPRRGQKPRALPGARIGRLSRKGHHRQRKGLSTPRGSGRP